VQCNLRVIQKYSEYIAICRDGSRFKDRPGAPPVSGLIESVSGPRPSALPSRLVAIIVCYHCVYDHSWKLFINKSLIVHKSVIFADCLVVDKDIQPQWPTRYVALVEIQDCVHAIVSLCCILSLTFVWPFELHI